MIQRHRVQAMIPRRRLHPAPLALALALLTSPLLAGAEPNLPVTAKQRGTAQDVAKAGVPLADLAPDAPDTYTVKKGDTLWGISSLFLKSPWRWPELWGMNLEQIRNPHLIYPGQLLVLLRKDGRATLTTGQPVEAAAGEDPTVRLGPRARLGVLGLSPVATIPMHLIRPFLTSAVVLETNELESAPRIVAGRDGRVLLGRGDRAYVRGTIPDQSDWRIFRNATPLLDPDNGELLGYEAAYVGAAEYTRQGETTQLGEGKEEIVPATFTLTSMRQEAGIGDRLAPAPRIDDSNFVPHAPAGALTGRVISLYGEAMAGGQYSVIALNRGQRDGVERGHVLALWRAGSRVVDKGDPLRPELQLPDEAHGHVLVFRVFERVSYGLVLNAETPVRAGDVITQP